MDISNDGNNFRELEMDKIGLFGNNKDAHRGDIEDAIGCGVRPMKIHILLQWHYISVTYTINIKSTSSLLRLASGKVTVCLFLYHHLHGYIRIVNRFRTILHVSLIQFATTLI